MNDTVHLPAKKLTEQEVSQLLKNAMSASDKYLLAQNAYKAARSVRNTAWAAHRAACKALEQGT